MKTKTNKTSKKSISRKKLIEWSLQVRSRDHHRCFICGSTEHIQAHHICQKKLWKELRYDIYNGITLCVKHHAFGQFSVHRGTSLLLDYLLKKHRPDQYRYLINKIIEKYEKTT